MQRRFLGSLLTLVVLNLAIKPVWVFGIDRQVQNVTGFEAYGGYFALLNFCYLFSFILDPGINLHFNRQAAARPSEAMGLFAGVLGAKFWLTICYILIVAFAGYLTGVKDPALLLLLCLLQSAASLFILTRSCITALQRFRLDSLLSVVDKGFVLLTAGVLLLFPRLFGAIDITRFVVLQLAGLLLANLLAFHFLRRGTPMPPIRLGEPPRPGLFLSGLPFALNIFLMTVVWKADGFLLERLSPQGALEAGVFASGHRLLDAFYMLCGIVGTFLLPFLSRHWEAPERYRGVVAVSRNALLWVAVTASAFAFLHPEWLTRLLYHRSDAPTVWVMRTVLLAMPGVALLHVCGTGLTAGGHIRLFCRISLVFAAASLLSNLLLIPRFGAPASAAINTSVVVCYALAVNRSLRRCSGIGLPAAALLLHAAAWGFALALLWVLDRAGLPPLPSLCVTGTALLPLYYHATGMGFGRLREALRGK